MAQIRAADVRTWYATAIESGGRTSVAQSYRFMRAVFNTALTDGLVDANPCRIPGAGTPRAPRRPTATPTEVAQLVEAISPQYRAAVVLAAWCGLRRGEILALHRRDIDLERGTVTVRATRTEMLIGGKKFDSPPKTDAAYRTIAMPPHIIATVEAHLLEHAGPSRAFVDATGTAMRGDSLYQAFVRARTKVGLRHLRFHDLRHTGQTLAAATGATLADLMNRLGHSSPAAAMRYLHTVEGRDAAIADALSELAQRGEASSLPKRSR